MRQLPLEKRYKGFEYRQVKKGNKAVIYEQKQFGSVIAYEVFKIKKHDGYEVKGRQIEAGESWPNDNAFGVWAWSVKTQKRALERFTELENKESICQEKEN